jgi:ABC-type amino acid transport system permease subunit
VTVGLQMNTVDILIQYKRAFLAGLATTGALAGIIIAFGLVVGTLLGIL